MVLTTAAVVVGIVVGLVRGGRPSAVLRAPVRWALVLPAGLVLQSVAERFDVPGRLALLVAGLFLLLAWAVRNTLVLAGAGVLAVGLAANLTVLVANGHVPVRWESLVAADRFAADQRDVVRSEGLYRLEDGDTRLAPLGDIIPLPVLDDLVSFGDLIILAGVVVLVSNLLLIPRRRRDGISPEELFSDDPVDARAETPAVIDLRQPLPDRDEHHRQTPVAR